MHPSRSFHAAAGRFALLGAAVLAAAAPLGAQETLPEEDSRAVSRSTADPLIPRGRLLFQIDAASTSLRGLHVDGEIRPLGEGFFPSGLGPDELPALAATESRFQGLMGEGSEWTLSLGAVGGRFEADEQVVPVRVGYGLLDRVSVGVTVPFVRRRITSLVGMAGTDATAGEAPTVTDPQQVIGFFSDAEQALAELETLVEEACAAPDDEDEGSFQVDGSCAEGQALLERASGFLTELDAAYDEEIVFPLEGSDGANLLLDRWASLRSDLAAWEVEGPEAPPVATRPLSGEVFNERFLEPVWGSSGFPRENPDVFMEMGDVEAHVVLGLLRGDEAAEGFRVRSSVVGTARFATGAVDSLQTLAPFAPPRGVSAVGGRLVTDILSPGRFALLAVAEGWWYGEAATVLLAPDPERVLGEGGIARAGALWQPGPTYRLELTPRVHLTPSLSLGAGYALDHRGADAYAIESLPDASPPGTSSGATLHRLRGEFRYHGFEEPMASSLPFPLELRVAYDQTITGSGGLAPAERRVEVGVRVLRGG